MTKAMKHQRVSAVVAAALFALGAAACGDDDSPDTGSPYGDTAAPEPTATAETPTGDDAPAAGAASLATDTDDELGEFLVDNAGMTLYLFTTDTGSSSTCYDQCATNWPPLLTDTEDVTAGGSVDASLISTTERNDGTMQVTYNDHPLYYYFEDSEPGETEGQNVGGVWYVVNPDGSAITNGG
ncbi:MAG TPA: hypothetical protein VHG10_12265 [Glycomyces sp.]|nr:hypothetical protein [Glycomyces sp.]